MSWIHAFELMCYAIVTVMLIDLILKKNYNSLFTFRFFRTGGFCDGAAAEAVTDIYYYNPNFLLNLGLESKQFPVFGGFMWGILTVYGIKLAQKLKWDKRRTALVGDKGRIMKDYTVQKIKVDGLKLLILLPSTNIRPKEHTPGILWIHGGGYAVGMAGMLYMSCALNLVRKYGAVVVPPEYRLAGKAPYPAALEDCYTALKYIKDHADELGCSRDQIMAGGESAGGSLTAALCIYARDRGEIQIVFQMPLYPMIDDRDTDSSRDNHGISWNTRRNHAAWKLYLRAVDGEPTPSQFLPGRPITAAYLPPIRSWATENLFTAKLWHS